MNKGESAGESAGEIKNIAMTGLYCSPPDQDLKRPDCIAAGSWRRLDPHARQAVCAVHALSKEHPQAVAPDNAVVVATSLGAITSTTRMLDSIADHGDAATSPTPFTTSIHNTTAGCLGECFQISGPCSTISQGGLSTLTALRFAWMLLKSKRCRRALLVIGELITSWSDEVISQLTKPHWPVRSCMQAVLLEADSTTGRAIAIGEQPARQCLDKGGTSGTLSAANNPADTRLASQAAAKGQTRILAPNVLGYWNPCCLLQALPQLPKQEAVQLRERDGLQELSIWLGPDQT